MGKLIADIVIDELVSRPSHKSKSQASSGIQNYVQEFYINQTVTAKCQDGTWRGGVVIGTTWMLGVRQFTVKLHEVYGGKVIQTDLLHAAGCGS